MYHVTKMYISEIKSNMFNLYTSVATGDVSRHITLSL
jgi:hypothetical protein